MVSLEMATKKFKRVVIVVDGVFSMTGSLCPVNEVAALAKKYNVEVYIDDAHGIGVMGRQGRGTVDHFGLTDEVDYIMGTFSKSFASIGGLCLRVLKKQ